MTENREQIELFKVFCSDEAVAEVSKTLQSGMLTQGPQNTQFEQMLKHHFGVENIATVNSATSGLQLALRALRAPFPESGWPGLEPGDEILTPALTCTATNWPVMHEGLKIKWVDSDPETACACVTDIAKKLTKTTKIVQVVHWGGTPVDVQTLRQVLVSAKEELGFTPVVIEDCAHAFGGFYQDCFTRIGTSGNVCVFSFQAIKLLTTGDGGCVITEDQTDHGKFLIERCRRLRWFGIDRERRRHDVASAAAAGADFRMEDDIPEAGFKFHMNDVNSAMGIGNLPHISALLCANRSNAAFLQSRILPLSHVRVVGSRYDVSSCWLFSLRVSDKAAFLKHCSRLKITTSQVHRRNDKHSAVAASSNHTADLPGVDLLERELICVPVGWWLAPEELERVACAVETFDEFMKEKKNI